MSSLSSLPAQLDVTQIESLRDLLALPRHPDSLLSPQAFNGVKNAAADLLLRQDRLPEELTLDLADMAADVAYDEIWRDYCLQMLSVCYERLAGRSDRDSAAERVTAVAALRDASKTRDHTWPGTALLGLDAVSRLSTSDVPADEVESLALAIAIDTKASEAARITALRVGGARRLAALRDSAWELAQTAGTETLRAAAIATLGEIGQPGDTELLQSLAHDADTFIARIAKSALEALTATRLAEGGGQ